MPISLCATCATCRCMRVSCVQTCACGWQCADRMLRPLSSPPASLQLQLKVNTSTCVACKHSRLPGDFVASVCGRWQAHACSNEATATHTHTHTHLCTSPYTLLTHSIGHAHLISSNSPSGGTKVTIFCASYVPRFTHLQEAGVGGCALDGVRAKDAFNTPHARLCLPKQAPRAAAAAAAARWQHTHPAPPVLPAPT